MTEPARPLLEFPCSFPLKVIGNDADGFEEFVLAVFGRHVSSDQALAVTTRPSGAGKYLAVTVTFTAVSQEQIDGLYRELGASERVVITL